MSARSQGHSFDPCPRSLRFRQFHIFFSGTTGQIEAEFHMEPPYIGATKIFSNISGHMTKMTALPIYGKNLYKSSSLLPIGRSPWNLAYNIGHSSTIKFHQMITIGWSLPFWRNGQLWFLRHLYGKMFKLWITQKLIWNYWSMIINVGVYSKLNKYMEILMYKRSSSLFVQGHAEWN